MARVNRVEVVCDREPDGKERLATKQVEIKVGDRKEKVDLCDTHFHALERHLGMSLNGRGPSKRAAGPRRTARPRAARSTDAAEIRAWAAKNGHDLPQRGRIPTAVRQAYEGRKKK